MRVVQWRAADTGDADALAKLTDAGFELTWRKLDMTRDLRTDDGVAAFVLTLRDRDGEGRPVAALECLGTRQAWRRKGLASTLIAETLRECRAKGFPRARLQVDSTNPTAIELYTKLHFTDTGRGYSVLTRRLKAPQRGAMPSGR